MIQKFYKELGRYQKPHAWLSFYFCFRVPIGIIASAINVWSYFEYGLYNEGIIQAIISALIIVMFLFIMARKKYSYVAMTVALLTESFGFALNGLGTDAILLYASASVVYLVLNVYYFSKRQDFFVPRETLYPESHDNIEPDTEKAGYERRYCKFCGNEIDPLTKRCNNCGKQYFNKKSFLRVFCKLFLLLLIFLAIFLAVLCYRQSREIDALKQDLDSVQERARELESTINRLDNRLVFTTPSGYAFHHIDCPYIQGKDIEPWSSILQATSEGYTPCSRCFPGLS